MRRAADLPNIGPKSEQMLALAGITSLAKLQELGAVPAFCQVKRAGANASLNLLWALEGAILGIPWQQVAREHRTSLLLALEDYERDGVIHENSQRHLTIQAGSHGPCRRELRTGAESKPRLELGSGLSRPRRSGG